MRQISNLNSKSLIIFYNFKCLTLHTIFSWLMPSMICKSKSRWNMCQLKKMRQESRILKLGNLMKHSSIWHVFISNILTFTESLKSAMIKWCSLKREFSLRKLWSAQFAEFVNWKRTWLHSTQDLTPSTFI